MQSHEINKNIPTANTFLLYVYSKQVSKQSKQIYRPPENFIEVVRKFLKFFKSHRPRIYWKSFEFLGVLSIPKLPKSWILKKYFYNS